MSEESPTITESLLYLIKFIFSAGVIIFIIIMFTNFRPVMKLNSMERLSIEMAENMGQHSLVADRMVFDKDKLDFYDGTINEPYVRQCEYGYDAKITLMEETQCQANSECNNFCSNACRISQITADNCKCDKVCQCQKNNAWIKNPEWLFGYDRHVAPYYGEESSSYIERTYPVSIRIPNPQKPFSYYDDAKPAVMVLSIYDTWLTRLSCMIETSHRLKKTQTIKIPCITFRSSLSRECSFPLAKKTGNILCLYDMQSGVKSFTNDCRYFETPFQDFYYYYSEEYKEKVFLKSVPIKTQSLLPSYTQLCSSIPAAAIAGESDAVETVALCIEKTMPSGKTSCDQLNAGECIQYGYPCVWYGHPTQDPRGCTDMSVSTLVPCAYTGTLEMYCASFASAVCQIESPVNSAPSMNDRNVFCLKRSIQGTFIPANLYSPSDPDYGTYGINGGKCLCKKGETQAGGTIVYRWTDGTDYYTYNGP